MNPSEKWNDLDKIFPMDHETWKANTDERRKVEAIAEAE